MTELLIREMSPDDWKEVRRIYQQGIESGSATFETQTPTWEEWDKSHLPECRLTALNEGKILGWAALSRVSQRKAYCGAASVSIYVAEEARGKGFGKTLLNQLILESEKLGLWTLESIVFAENQASLQLHAACGFRIVGRRERIAQRCGVWHDTILLERRSKINGNEETS